MSWEVRELTGAVLPENAGRNVLQLHRDYSESIYKRKQLLSMAKVNKCASVQSVLKELKTLEVSGIIRIFPSFKKCTSNSGASAL